MGGVALRQVERDRAVAVEAHVPDVDRGEGARWALGAVMLAGDHPDAPGAVRQIDGGDVGAEDRLVAGPRQLVLRRQVHPQLHHPERSARAGESAGVELLVQDAAGGGHPLDVARADDPALAGGVAVLDLAVIDDGDRLEAAVRVLADATAGAGRFEDVRAGVVQQQERAHLPALAVVGKQRAHREAVADPMAAVVAVTLENLLHRMSPAAAGHGRSPR
jgi:hypothetical protein